MQKDKIKAYCQNVVDQYDVRCRSINDSVRTLSGGNQQKLVIGREFSLNPTFILAAQPTRGLDVGPSNLIIGKF